MLKNKSRRSCRHIQPQRHQDTTSLISILCPLCLRGEKDLSLIRRSESNHRRSRYKYHLAKLLAILKMKVGLTSLRQRERAIDDRANLAFLYKFHGCE